MGPRPFLIGAMLASLALAPVACRGKVASADAKSNLVGTWTRRHDGKIAQEITLTAAGTFDSVNPETGGAKERGTYYVAPDGKSIIFDGTDEATNARASYSWQVRFNGKDEIVATMFVGTTRSNEYTYQRKY
jgi:hypothetical protein